MPPRATKKTSAKSPVVKAKKLPSAPESSPASSLPSVDEEIIPEQEALSTHTDVDTLETETINGDALKEGDVSPSHAIAEESADPTSENSTHNLDDDDYAEEEETALINEEGSDAAENVEADEGNAENANNDQDLDMEEILSERNKLKECSIYVSGLDKAVVEDDLIKFFSVFGQVKSARIILRRRAKKNNGFAVIRFLNCEDAKKALTDFKNGTEIKGKQISIRPSQDDGMLYIGNISKSWTRDNVIERLKSVGIEQFDDMILPEDPKNEGKIKGFAFLEFNFQSTADLAFQRLAKSDTDFGGEMTAKVGFVRTLLSPNKDDELQVNTVYLQGYPPSWDNEKVKDICKEYGQIKNVQLSRNFTSKRRKDFGFVEFSSHESALACVAGINRAEYAEGDFKVTANIARPLKKKEPAKLNPKEGSMTKKVGETIQVNSESLKKTSSKSEKILPQEKLNKTKIAEGSNSVGKNDLNTTPNKKKKRSRKAKDTDGSPAKKMRYGQRRSGERRSDIGRPRGSRQGRFFAASSGYGRRQGFEPQLHPSDLVPHAGYLPPKKQAINTYAYDRRSGAYNDRPPSSSESVQAIFGQRAGYPSYQLAGYEHEAYAPPRERSYYY